MFFALDLVNKQSVELSSKGRRPRPRWYHSMSNSDDTIVVFGGYTSVGKHLQCNIAFIMNTTAGYSSETFLLNVPRMEWRRIFPPALYGSSATSVASMIYVFGGKTTLQEADDGALAVSVSTDELVRAAYSNELYLFDSSSDAWVFANVSGTPPSPRSYHAAASTGRFIYFFGGENYDGYPDDLFSLDTVSMTWTSIETLGAKPQGRKGAAMAAVGTVLYIYGGHSYSSKTMAV
eukprot:766593-Hanusia_phi.AAC.1